jgi:hypothetical protein
MLERLVFRGVEAWCSPPEPVPAGGRWLAPIVLVGAGAMTIAESDVWLYGLLCGALVPIMVLSNWLRFRTRLQGEGRDAVDRLFWVAALGFAWFALLLMHEGE